MEYCFHLRKYFVVLLILFGIQSILFAQITINQNDFDISFGQQFTGYTVNNPSGMPVSVGGIGGPQSWVFNQSTFPNGTPFSLTLVDPATTPFQSDFPSANFVFLLTDTLDLYVYFELTNTAVFSLGFGSVDSLNPVAFVSNPPEELLSLPAMMGATWSNNFVQVFSPVPGIEVRDSTFSTSEVDAWGTIDLPIGTLNCLRVRNNIHNTVSTIIPGIPPIVEIHNYIEYFWTTNSGIPYSLANIRSLDGETDPNFTMAEDVFFLINQVTGIPGEADDLPETFELQQNYPNPFNPSTTIEYQLSKQAEVALTVYNLNGEQVAILASGVQPAGTHRVVFEARNLPSGIYFYRLKTDNGVNLTKQMILLR